MDTKRKIEMLCAGAGLKKSAVAAQLGTTVQNFSSRLKTGKFTQNELTQIAEICGAKYVCYFELPDGTRI